MREIVTVDVGQCGISAGCKFWEVISSEHGLDACGEYWGLSDLQLQRIGTHFTESHSGKYVPRLLMVDLEPGSIDEVLNGPLRSFFSPEKAISGMAGGSNNFAKGYYTDGAELLIPSMEIVRNDAEMSDCLQGFQMIHSLGGGCGSGFGALMMDKLREEYPDRIISAYSFFPSPKVSDIVVEPYNATFGIHHLVDSSDISFILDNEALHDICNRTLKIPQPTYSDLNHVVCYAMTGATASLRFPGQLNSDFRKLAVNMIPFPRLHFFVINYAPLCHPNFLKYRPLSVKDLTSELFQSKNLMAACNPRAGRYLTASVIYRGHVSTKEVEEHLKGIQMHHTKNFVPWIPDNIKTTICDIAPPGRKNTTTFMGNTTSITELLKRVAEQFSAMYRRRAFLHWYIGEGIEELEFLEAESNLKDLISEYEQHNEADAQASNWSNKSRQLDWSGYEQDSTALSESPSISLLSDSLDPSNTKHVSFTSIP